MGYYFVVDEIPNNSGEDITEAGFGRFLAAVQARFDELQLPDEVEVVDGSLGFSHTAKSLPYYSRLNDAFEELLARRGGELLFS
jgi:hypothetical protein